MRKVKKSYNAFIFTLIELLIVIGIIAILASMLLPVLNKARAKARQTKCISNFKQIGTAVFEYDNDNNGWFPLINPTDTSKDPFTNVGYGGMLNANGIGYSNTPANIKYISGVGLLIYHKYLNQDRDLGGSIKTSSVVICDEVATAYLSINVPSTYSSVEYFHKYYQAFYYLGGLKNLSSIKSKYPSRIGTKKADPRGILTYEFMSPNFIMHINGTVNVLYAGGNVKTMKGHPTKNPSTLFE